MKDKDKKAFRELIKSQLMDFYRKAQLEGSNTVVERERLSDVNDLATAEYDTVFQGLMKERERRLVQGLTEALRRIDEDEFGECEHCGEEISLQRLKVMPTCSTCITCQSKIESGALKID